MRATLRGARDGLALELEVWRTVLKDERTPRLTRWLLGFAIAYALSPIDLIPDWVPLVGHVDDILIVPVLVWLALRYLPEGVVAECRAQVEELNGQPRATRR